MKLYMVPAAPNPTKVMLYIAEKAAAGTDMGIEQVIVNTLKGQQRSDEHLARNPFGTIPVLELEEGDYIIESLAIIEYLEEHFPTPPMWGETARERAAAREAERVADLKVLGNIGRYIHATNSPIGLPKRPEVAAEAEEALQSGFGHFERMLADGRPLLLGERVTVADCTLQSALQFMRFGKADLVSAFANVVQWDQRYREREAAQAVLKF